MTAVNTPCDKHYITAPSRSGLSFRPLILILKQVFNKKPKKQMTTFHALHGLPDHLKLDLGLRDIRPPMK